MKLENQAPPIRKWISLLAVALSNVGNVQGPEQMVHLEEKRRRHLCLMWRGEFEAARGLRVPSLKPPKKYGMRSKRGANKGDDNPFGPP